jgi:sulfur-carrier protein adenylyltransferase/sulfurtransferase
MRYQRQMILPEVGIAGQERLLAARVLVVGAGALGSAAALYLAAAGVGTLGIVDGDRVEEHNLHRQVLHGTADVGRLKTESARDRLAALNDDVRVVQHREFLDTENVLEIFGGYDLVVNGSDNFATRYLVNDACVLLGKPLVDAAILRFEGQLTVFQPGKGCYRCLFPTPPPPGSVPDCAQAGVFGALAGVLGSLEAVEALKLVVGIAPDAAPRLRLFDALGGEWHGVRVRRDPECALCGDHPTITRLLDDYQVFCGVGPVDVSDVPTLSAREAAAWLGDGRATLVDVRTPVEVNAGRIPGSVSVPLADLDAGAAEWQGQRPIVCVCAMGGRSAQAAARLRAAGVDAYSLAGGVLAWQAEGLPWQEPAPSGT